jgi:hypothetical protein
LPAAQGMRGLIRGLIGGIVPGAGFADQVWSETGRLPQGSRNERIGRAIGEIIGGGLTTFLGAGGEIGGMGLFATGGGAPLGAMAMAASAGAVTAGLANMGAGMRGLTQALMMEGDGEGAKGRGRGANHLQPDSTAQGSHSTFKTDAQGRTTGQAEWLPNPRNPSGFDEVKRVDITGEPHYNKVTGEHVPTPHVHEKGATGGVRPARPDEVP